MVTQAIEKARYSCGPRMIKYYPEAGSTQTFKKGEMVYMESDGQIVPCADDATKILGMVLQDASGTENTMLPVLIAQDGTEFEMNLYHATVGSAVTALTNRDQKFGYEVNSNIAYVDIGSTSADSLMITEILTGGGKSVGDTYGRVRVVVLPEAQQLGATGT